MYKKTYRIKDQVLKFVISSTSVYMYKNGYRDTWIEALQLVYKKMVSAIHVATSAFIIHYPQANSTPLDPAMPRPMPHPLLNFNSGISLLVCFSYSGLTHVC